MNEPKTAGRSFVVPRCQPSLALELVEASPDPVSQGINNGVSLITDLPMIHAVLTSPPALTGLKPADIETVRGEPSLLRG